MPEGSSLPSPKPVSNELEAIVARFAAAWQSGASPSIDDFLPENPELRRPALLRLVQGDLQSRLKSGQTVRIETYLERYPELATDPTGVMELAQVEYSQRRQTESGVAASEYLKRFPQCDAIQEFLSEHSTRPPDSQWEHMEKRPAAIATSAGILPPRLGRYRIVERLGSGGFGSVYKAYDEDLRRDVAIKIPLRVPDASEAEAFLAEARALAGLDHRGIVPIYDAGRLDDGRWYLVSKFIAGSDLAKRLRQGRPPLAEAVALVAGAAEALHHAHQRGLVHRDVKPANILIDESGNPVVADFGMALRDEDFGKGPGWGGTPEYMSPEQARGEGHRVDARSDIYSLGLVFYELLTGQRPFQGELAALIEQIARQEPRPPRQMDEAISKELDRICLKALAKRAADRFSTARDLADDLRHWLAREASGRTRRRPRERKAGSPDSTRTIPTGLSSLGLPMTGPASLTRLVGIVPKGLRSFDAADSDFFLQLLPGPRDRDGLPESIRFWKKRIESLDAEEAFSVGLVYGPSGCGKSSLIKAGLLPRLAPHVRAIYLEATPADTEKRVLRALRKRLAEMTEDTLLSESMARLRRERGLQAGKKVLLVLDQFEQWLHAHRADADTELVRALRQCDGVHIQCLLMVRDDFWMAATRLMQALEVPLVEGKDAAAVDLFDLRHARKVLAGFGYSLGCLTDNAGQLSDEQERFLDQAVAGLAQDDKIISVRLALFAEMAKSKPWTLATLKTIGGAQGIGLTFLEETFAGAGAPPEHRLHEKAARKVLGSLLPEAGIDLKSHMRSREELLAASGYARQPADFDRLLRILDTELRLVTPVDPSGSNLGEESEDKKEESESTAAPPPAQYYQLTHDYLVPALRQWLTRKQKETARGRAELRLSDRTALWSSRPEQRYLPGFWEWANIRLLTGLPSWTADQKTMMGQATRLHTVRGLVLLVVLAGFSLGGWFAWEQISAARKADRAVYLVQNLMDAEIGKIPEIVAELQGYRARADPLLLERTFPPATKTERLHALLALVATHPEQMDPVVNELLGAQPDEVPIIRDFLLPYREAVTARLWGVLTGEQSDSRQKLRAAAVLARYDTENPRWSSGGAAPASFVAETVVRENALHLRLWADALRPIKDALYQPLSAIFRDRKRSEDERAIATQLLADYFAGDPDKLVALLRDADDRQYVWVFAKLRDHRDRAVALMTGQIQTPPVQDPSGVREGEARGQAQLAVALLQLAEPSPVWRLLRHSPDPRVRSWLIHRLRPLGADPHPLVETLEADLASPRSEVSIRRALLLALGEFELGAEDKQRLTPRLLEAYQNDPDAGMHSAIDWLLTRWGAGKELQALDDKLQSDEPRSNRGWYVNREGITFAVFRDLGEPFLMGSPKDEPGRDPNDQDQHPVRVGRHFAIATKLITNEQFQRFLHDHPIANRTFPTAYSKEPTSPAGPIEWFDAARYCQWLTERGKIPSAEWCYPRAADVKEDMRLPAGYLTRTGYRLPTEAEWEFACRAGAITSRFYGNAKELLSHYAWYVDNSDNHAWPVGLKEPNDFGLFDMQGNAWQWCQERWPGRHTEPSWPPDDAAEDTEPITLRTNRVLRGGSFASLAAYLRSASRDQEQPNFVADGSAIRVVRTLKQGAPSPSQGSARQ